MVLILKSRTFLWYRSKTTKVKTSIEFCIFKLVLVPNFSLNWQFWLLGQNLPKKGISGLKQIKWICKKQIKFAKKIISGMKQIKWIGPLSSTYSNLSRHRIFKIKWQFWFFEPNLSKVCVSVEKWRKYTSAFNSAYLK